MELTTQNEIFQMIFDCHRHDVVDWTQPDEFLELIDNNYSHLYCQLDSSGRTIDSDLTPSKLLPKYMEYVNGIDNRN